MSKGLVLDLKMRDKQGSVVTDYSRYGNDGAVNGGVVWTEQGMRFDGSSGYLNCGNDASLNDVDALTVSVITKVNTYIASEGLVVKGEGGAISNPPYSLQLDATGFMFLTVNAANGVKQIQAPGYNDTNHWYHLVGTFNSGKIHFYIDGTEIGTGIVQTDIGATTGDLLIGQQKAGSNRYVDASIDEVRIYNYALPLREIKAMYNSTRHNYE